MLIGAFPPLQGCCERYTWKAAAAEPDPAPAAPHGWLGAVKPEMRFTVFDG